MQEALATADDHPEMQRGRYRPVPALPQPVFAVETIKATREEAWPLLERHWAEIAQFKDLQVLDPDWDAYNRLEEMGRLWVMTVRIGGKLVGYTVMIVSNDLHYRKLLRAQEDIHFILPEYRKGLLGYRMLKFVKGKMQAKGVRMISFRTKASHSHGPLFERLGGVLHDLVYTIVL